jgi:hypothetical protein
MSVTTRSTQRILEQAGFEIAEKRMKCTCGLAALLFEIDAVR